MVHWRIVRAGGLHTQRQHAKVNVEHRKHHRVSVDLPVEITAKTSDTRVPGLASDLSLGGMFVRTAQPQPFGAQVVVHATLTPKKTPFQLAAVVRWTREDGMGLQFLPLGAHETHAIMELTDQLHEQSRE